MKRSLVPVIYDFKRSFFRLSTLILLAVFIVAGIGLSYLSYSMVSNLAGPVRTLGVIVVDGDNVLVYGVAYDFTGKELSGASIVFLDSSGRTLFETRINGVYHLSFKAPANNRIARVKIMYNGKEASEPVLPLDYINNTYQVLYYAAFNTLSMTENGGILWTPQNSPRTYLVASLLLLDKSSGDALLQIVSINTTDRGFRPNYELLIGCVELGVTSTSKGNINTSLLPRSIVYKTIDIRDYFVRKRIRVDPSDNVLIMRINGTDKALLMRYDGLQPAKAFMAGSMLSSSGLSLFLNFFPIVFLYLAHILMAKPKATGALEFILARPVTKWDLYITRYVSGVLVALASSAIFVIALDIASATIWGIMFGAYPSVIMFLAIFVGLVAWYSFCYMLASGIKSSSRYLALAIIFYLLFAMFWGLIVLLIAISMGVGITAEAAESLGYKLNMLNPIKISDLILYYMRLHYGLVAPMHWINPGVVAATSLAWIMAPFVLGYLVFKRD